MRHRRTIYHAPRSKLDAEVALLLGLHAGDGWASSVWGLSLSAKDERMVGIAVGLARRVLGVEPFVSRNKSESIAVRSGHKQAIEFFVSYGFPRGRKSTTVSVPQRILSSQDRDIISSFLRGLFSSDGCFSIQRRAGRSEIQVSSPALRDGFAELASRLGYHFRTYAYVHRKGWNKLPLQVAFIGRREMVRRWMEEIGSLSDTHLKRYEMWTRLIGIE
jgi:hypothetical protein